MKEYKQTSFIKCEVTVLGEIRGVVSEEIEGRFRKLAMRKFGYGKGSLSKALEEALLQWIALVDN